MGAAQTGAGGFTELWRPVLVSAEAASFARAVVQACGPHGRERAKNLLWAAGRLADWAIPLGLEPVPGVLLHPSVSERFTAHAPGLTGVTRRTLRTNLRFVARAVVPQLQAADAPLPRERAACSGVYAHVTGHGLCVRLSLLRRLPFPARSPLEDMHYSFILGSRGLPMIAVPSLDSAEVPDSVTAQLQQAARWFFGPARFARYLKDPATLRGWRATAMAASAFGSAAEWLACAVAPALLVVLVTVGSGPVRSAAGTVIAICCTQVVVTEVWLGAPAQLGARLTRLIAFPLACTVHGVGGIVGAASLLAGSSGTGKTERSGARR